MPLISARRRSASLRLPGAPLRRKGAQKGRVGGPQQHLSPAAPPRRERSCWCGGAGLGGVEEVEEQEEEEGEGTVVERKKKKEKDGRSLSQ